MAVIYPGEQWDRVSPDQAGFDPRKLSAVKTWLAQQAGEQPYRVVIVRGGSVVAEWNQGVDRTDRLQLASAAKSIFSCLLAIAIEEGKIEAADARVIDYYPEAMDVPDGEGPKPGRYAFEKDRDITFRQLISNTSGYMKPGENPGEVFHYQTYGMNILTHAIAKTYGLYDPADPEGSPGLKALVEEKIAQPIGAQFDYYLGNFDLHTRARINIFGYYDGVAATALDMARLGWLWLNQGRWQDRQLVPAGWMRSAGQIAPDIRAHCPQDQWVYGYGFWTNACERLWPGLPSDAYGAAGAGKQYITLFPGYDLVVVQSPGLWGDHDESTIDFLSRILEACSH